MPEGHVIHRLAEELDRAFAGRSVTVTSPQGRFAHAAEFLDGMTLRRAEAYGKHLVVDFSPVTEELPEGSGPLPAVPDEPGGGGAERLHGPSPGRQGPFVHIHLGLIGKLRWVPPGRVGGEDTLRLRIETEEHAVELRGPQTCALIGPAELAAQVAALGPDPLRPDADPGRAWLRVHRSERSIASLLMDQRVAAGVGNIYRAEVLYRQRIHPDTAGNRLSRRAWNRVWADLVELMPQGVRQGRIDTVRPENSPEVTGRDPRVDRHGGEVYVYRRAGQPCLVCGRAVRSRVFEGRNLYWCAGCQRRR
jgi:formamidopyrimidine-DNA glycosylase